MKSLSFKNIKSSIRMKKNIKILVSLILIILVVLPMFLYLNPFAWGMRPTREYYSKKTDQLITDLNMKYSLEMDIKINLQDTLWYFRDVKNHRIVELKNIEFHLHNETDEQRNSESMEDFVNELRSHNEEKQQEKAIDTIKVRKYIEEFCSKFEHRMYFDSIKVKSYQNNAVIYKIKINE